MLGYNLHRASSAVNNHLAAAFAEQGLRGVHLAMLATLAEQPGLSQRQLSRLLAIKPANMVAMVNELEAAGLVLRTTDPKDRRVQVLTLGEAAERSMAALEAQLAEHERHFRAQLSAEEARVLLDVLHRLWQDEDAPGD